MFKAIITAATIASLITTPAMAADDLFFKSRLGQQQDVQVRLYLSVPLGGGSKRSRDLKPRFGLALNYTQEYRPSMLLTDRRARFQANLLDLSFDRDSKLRFAALGVDAKRYRELYAKAKEGEKKGMSTVTIVLIGLGVGLVGFTAFGYYAYTSAQDHDE
jgi:hypothetical protein